jgi:hypothetical protein
MEQATENTLVSIGESDSSEDKHKVSFAEVEALATKILQSSESIYIYIHLNIVE